jgi:hypothetical protein
VLDSPAVASTGQAALTLRNLAARIREAHAGVVASLRSAAVHALVAGAYLTEAKGLSGHGRFGEFLHACGVNDRTARQYMQLAKLAGIKTVPGTDLIETAKAFVAANLASLSVKGPVQPDKLLARPSPQPTSSAASKPSTSTSSRPGSMHRPMSAPGPSIASGSSRCLRRCRKIGSR